MSIEKAGLAFYKKAAKKLENPNVQGFFGKRTCAELKPILGALGAVILALHSGMQELCLGEQGFPQSFRRGET
ncbi:MAG: hypothetical protein A3K09_02350 [Nitrospinae bacterium RIFCSPLOWO2_12_FULL_47_7]|nr:MAG: hypothetical protein A3K09_02350 [Nitrospinae bacterium RIFCSPLOWO2_12_FULL_47_7]